MEILDAIRARRSMGRMLPEAPTREQIEQVLTAAVQAPNHHETQPWRFFVLQGDARQRFGDALEGALRRRMADDDPALVEQLAQAERKKPLRSPVVIVVAVKHDPAFTKHPAFDDTGSTMAAVQNMLLAAHSLGLAAIWRTGLGIFDSEVKAHFGLAPADEIVASFYLGLPDTAREGPPPRQRSFADKTVWWH